MNKSYLQQIEEYLRSEGFTDPELMADLKDHLATEIEFLMTEGESFEDSFEQAKAKLLPNTPYQLERDLKLLTTQKHNIMIKKIAFIGGYVSAITICLSILFIALSYQAEVQVEKRKDILQSQYFRTQFPANAMNSGVDIDALSEAQDKFYLDTTEMKMSSLKRLELGQTLMVISVLIFMLTYLPYRFYNGYQKSDLELA